MNELRNKEDGVEDSGGHRWSLEETRHIYRLARGDLHFLDVNQKGELELVLNGTRKSLVDMIEHLDVQGSFTLRIPQLVLSQIKKLLDAFKEASDALGFKGKFHPLYPIKVNQRKLELSPIIQGAPFYGLEAGTRSEFAICKKVLRNHHERIIMSNGVKDQGYFTEMAKAVEEGYTIYISIEAVSELRKAIKCIPRDKLRLFFRIKPYCNIRGHWNKSAGRDSKFGLDSHQLMECIKILKEEGLESTLIGIHAHPGSQVTDLDGLKDYAQFMRDVYFDLRRQGFLNLNIINFGGGLPIDYKGRLPVNFFDLYFHTILGTVLDGIEEKNHPNIMVEAGRAISALSSIVIVHILETEEPNVPKKPLPFEELLKLLDLEHPSEVKTPSSILSIWSCLKKKEPKFSTITDLNWRETHILQLKRQLRSRFLHSDGFSDWLEEAEEILMPDVKVLGNFSVFNSACDHVLVSQYFPVIPINHLLHQPETLVRLVDITCDSDGELSNFITAPSPPNLWTLDGYPLCTENEIFFNGIPVPKVDRLAGSYLAIPLVGAYQDIIEFDHNLLGDLPDVLVVEEKGELKTKILTKAESIENLVHQVGYVLNLEDDPYVKDKKMEE